MVLAWLPLVAAAATTPYAGVTFEPFGRGDLVWVQDDRTSGLSVGEFDGVVAPSLGAFAGAWLGKHVALQGELGVARLTTTAWVGDVYRQRHWGVLRPAVDLRYGFGRREVGRASPWLMVGLHGDIPSARDVSDGYTEEEQDVADENAYAERLRLGGFGGRIGAGVDYRLRPGLAIGATYAVQAHWGVLRSEEASTISSWLASQTTLLFTFEWPTGGAPEQPAARRTGAPGAGPPQPSVASLTSL